MYTYLNLFFFRSYLLLFILVFEIQLGFLLILIYILLASKGFPLVSSKKILRSIIHNISLPCISFYAASNVSVCLAVNYVHMVK